MIKSIIYVGYIVYTKYHVFICRDKNEEASEGKKAKIPLKKKAVVVPHVPAVGASEFLNRSRSQRLKGGSIR